MEELDKIVEEKAKELIKSEEKAIVEQTTPTFDSLQNDYFKQQVGQGKTISEMATDFVKAKTTSDIMKNENGQYDGLHNEFAKEQKETLKQSFVQDRVEQEAKTLTAKQQKAEAFYVSFRPILEFDFSHLIHKKDKSEKEQKTYKDRSYGIPLMVLMLALFVMPYCVVSIILALLNGINAICEAVATFSKSARIIVLSILFVITALLLVYCALLGIDKIFGTSIVSRLGL